MILKILFAGEPPFNTKFIDSISEINFRDVHIENENDLKQFKIKYFFGKKEFPVEIGLISYLRNSDWVQIAFQAEVCYLLNDSGDTIEKFVCR